VLDQIFSILGFIAVMFGMSDGMPRRIDLDGARVTFADNFNHLDVSAHGPSRWSAHTWWNGDFGEAVFADPEPAFPFTVKDGVLSIEAKYDQKQRRWRSGLLSTIDAKGHGFAQQYGYFEMRAKLPPGPGVWPAFWMVETGSRQTVVEIDAMELYGHAPKRYDGSLHVWHRDSRGDRSYGSVIYTPHPLSDAYHLYGVVVLQDVTGFYLDRRLVGVAKTPPELRRPMGVLLNLALGGGWPIDETNNPSIMQVDYVRVYELPLGWPRKPDKGGS
jgi:beta-glucanase (GH16 family)